MPIDLSKSLVIGISSRALFDLEESNRVFEAEGEAAYIKYQEQREAEILQPGIGFRLVQAILGLNSRIREKGIRKAEVVVTSRNSPATSMRLFASIDHYKLDIQRAILTSGTPVARYLKPFVVDLYLSAYEKDVEEAMKAGIAAGVIYLLTAEQKCSAGRGGWRSKSEAHNRAVLRAVMMGVARRTAEQEAPRCTPRWSCGPRSAGRY